MSKILVNQEKCVACGRCTEMCPNVFRLCLGNGCKIQIISEKGKENLTCAMRASDECPVEAIRIEE